MMNVPSRILLFIEAWDALHPVKKS